MSEAKYITCYEVDQNGEFDHPFHYHGDSRVVGVGEIILQIKQRSFYGEELLQSTFI